MDPGVYLDLRFFRENGFKRGRCRSCGSYFWTLDKEMHLCGDQPCVDFSFIDNPVTKRSYSLSKMREEFLSFFEDRNHTRIKPYPVVARWRKDIYLTIASIADFQPHVTSGQAKPPANPLVVSQPSIRLNDLEEVGVSGKHLTIFEMMGHHAFNSREEYVYWTEETVKYCHEFLSSRLGIDERSISYKESIWEGGGNAGPCLEVLVGGLEVATLVFMNMEENKNGKIEIDGKRYSEMNMRIVDTGYGLERLTWISRGTSTIYDVVYPRVVEYIESEGGSKNKHLIYALADHTKCIAFMLGDGIVPSNVRAGYLARLMIRRALRFMKLLGLRESLYTLVEIHLKDLKKDFPHLYGARRRIEEILEIEEEKYNEILSRGDKLVEKLLEGKTKLDINSLIQLYDTHGIHPDIVKSIANKMGLEIEVPKNFDSLVAKLHSGEKEEKEKIIELPISEKTRTLYYEDEYMRMFKANVIWSGRINGNNIIILDKTAFYPEGGGQPSDHGKLLVDGKEIIVRHVERVNGTILHYTDELIDEGKEVEGIVDWDRRYSLMRHHTATHVINSACRKILGDHVWQAGSQLDTDEARFDFSHYKPLDERDLNEIEKAANDLIKKGRDVVKEFIERSEAERAYGVVLYQGGVPEGRIIRIVRIPDIDVEACGGTHLNNISEIERIKIIRGERIQDGVDRIVFVAGRKKVEELERKEREKLDRIVSKLESRFDLKEIEWDANKVLQRIAKLYSVPKDKIEITIDKFLRDLPKDVRIEARNVLDACDKLFSEWKRLQKEKKRIPKDMIEKLISLSVDLKGYRFVLIEDAEILENHDPLAVAEELAKFSKTITCIRDKKGLVFSASEDVNIDLRNIARMVGSIIGGGGGGKEKLSRCGGEKLENIKIAIEEAKKLIESQLSG